MLRFFHLYLNFTPNLTFLEPFFLLLSTTSFIFSLFCSNSECYWLIGLDQLEIICVSVIHISSKMQNFFYSSISLLPTDSYIGKTIFRLGVKLLSTGKLINLLTLFSTVGPRTLYNILVQFHVTIT